MRRTLSILLVSLVGSTASAGVYGDCWAAIEAGDTKQVKQLARQIMRLGSIPKQNRDLALECVNAAMDGEYAYSTVTHEIVPKSRKEELDRAERLLGGVEPDEIERREADAEGLAHERRAAARRRLEEACVAQFHVDPDATIMNQLCFDVFLAKGLPEG